MSPEPADVIADAIHEHLCARATHHWPDVIRADWRRHEQTARKVLAALATNSLVLVPVEDLRYALALTAGSRAVRAPDQFTAAADRLERILESSAAATQGAPR